MLRDPTAVVRAGQAGVAVLLLLTACAKAPQPASSGRVDMARVQNAQEGGQWLLTGRNFQQDRFSPLTQINAQNIERLGLAWEFRDFVVRGRTRRGVEANPVFVDGMLYFSGPWGVAYAADAHTGKLLWNYDPQVDGAYARKGCCDVVSRGLAVWRGRVYSASFDGWLTALDAASGKVIWRVDTFVDRSMPYTITGAPHIAGENILIGNAGADMGAARGYVSAYDLRTGRLAWRFWTVPGDPAKGPDETPEVTLARKTWSAKSRWDLGGGGTVWDSMAYDSELNLAYLGVGNGGPHPIAARSPGGGDNLFLTSIVAVDARTGRMKWYYQTTPGDSWDYAATAHLLQADIQWNGRLRKVIMQAPKNGIFYVLDRETGELLKADPYTTVNWTRGVDLATGRPIVEPTADYSKQPRIIWPSAAGGHSWQPMSRSGRTGLVYFPVYDAPMKVEIEPADRFVRGFVMEGLRGQFPPFSSPEDQKLLEGQPEPKMETRLKAWDPVAGKSVWTSEPLPFVSGGVLTTASGLVFQGATDGVLSVYDDSSGKVLRRIDTGTAIMAAPITYEFDGVQYVVVMAGAGGPQAPMWAPNVAAAKYQNFERLMAFRLDGGVTPLPPPVVEPDRQPLPQAIPATAETLARGETLYRTFCQRCHAVGDVSGAYPNLWNLPRGTLDAFESIVYSGVLRSAGMAAFSDVLSKEDVQAIKAFIVTDTIRKRAQGNDAGAHTRDSFR